MILLDTDIVVLLAQGNAHIAERVESATDWIATTVVTRVEILRGRFDFLLKAADGVQLQKAQHWLDQSERDLLRLDIVPIDVAAAATFDKLRRTRRLKNVGRADLLIASIAIARKATVVTRNVKHFALIPNLTVENWAE